MFLFYTLAKVQIYFGTIFVGRAAFINLFSPLARCNGQLILPLRSFVDSNHSFQNRTKPTQKYA